MGGENAAKKALSRLNPQKIATQEVPVVFLNDVATGLISHLAAAISGGSLYRKASFYWILWDTKFCLIGFILANAHI